MRHRRHAATVGALDRAVAAIGLRTCPPPDDGGARPGRGSTARPAPPFLEARVEKGEDPCCEHERHRARAADTGDHMMAASILSYIEPAPGVEWTRRRLDDLITAISGFSTPDDE